MERLRPSFKDAVCGVLLAGGILFTSTACQSAFKNGADIDRAYAKNSGIHYIQRDGFIIFATDRDVLKVRVQGEDASDWAANRQRADVYIRDRCDIRSGPTWLDLHQSVTIVRNSSCIDKEE